MFAKTFNNLKIKHKLILLAGIPMLLVLILALDIILNEFNKLQEVQASHEIQNYISETVTMVHELQLERGFSAGYLASNGDRFQRELQHQRTRVDHHVRLLRNLTITISANPTLHEHFNNLSAKSTPQEHHNNFIDTLEKRLQVRSDIDELNPASDFFQYFSNTNAIALEQIQRLSMRSSDAHLLQDSQALGVMLWLQEYAGQERGSLNRVLASGKINLEKVQQLQNLAKKQEEMIRRFRNVIATPPQRAILDFKLENPVIERIEKIRLAIYIKAEKIDLLATLQHLIGYGGLIHNFKNYVLRGTTDYRDRFKTNFIKTQEVLKKYRQLPNISDTEINDLDIVETMTQTYRSYLDKIIEKSRSWKDIQGIDRLVKIDDEPALAAITRLRKNTYEIDPAQWFQDATQRIELFKEVSDHISEDLFQDMNELLRQAESRSTSTIVIMVLAIFGSFIIAGYITKRLVTSITGITEVLQRAKSSGNFDEYTTVTGRDEIGEMAYSLNTLIVERRLTDEVLRNNRRDLEVAKEAADKANQAKSEFLARMSHELRTPMNAILGFGQLMEYDEELQPHTQQGVHEILGAGYHLLELINDVLDLARIESGRIEVANKPVSCNKMIDEAISLVAPLAAQRNITLSNDSDQCTDIVLNADPTRLKEVMLNLLSNAVKYNREGGSVTISSEPAPGKRWRINVHDTGNGMTDEQQQHLFQPFERLGAEHTEVEGTGIGLVIIKRIVEMMGGFIGVHSIPGQGSTFWFELNTFESNATEIVTDEKPGSHKLAQEKFDTTALSHKGYSILYVEDNPSNIRLIEYLLNEHTDIPLLVAMTAQKGLELAAANMFDLILLDTNLPDMDGFELSNQLRKLDNYHETPIVAVSANAMPQDIKRAMEAGFSEYLTKPINLPRFFAVLNRFLARNVTNAEFNTPSSDIATSTNQRKYAD